MNKALIHKDDAGEDVVRERDIDIEVPEAQQLMEKLTFKYSLSSGLLATTPKSS